MNISRRFKAEREKVLEFYGKVLGLAPMTPIGLGANNQMSRFQVGTSELKFTTASAAASVPGARRSSASRLASTSPTSRRAAPSTASSSASWSCRRCGHAAEDDALPVPPRDDHINLFSPGTPHAVNTHTSGIQYVVSNVDAVDAAAKARSVKIDQPLSPPGNGLRTVWLADPDGVTNYFAETGQSRAAGRTQ